MASAPVSSGPSLLSSLGVVCSACDHLNLAQKTSCEGCGRALTETPGPPPIKLAKSRPPPLKSPLPPPILQPVVRSAPPSRPAPKAPAILSPSATREAPPSPWALAVVGGESQGRRFQLTTAGIEVGRNRGTLLFPEDRFISSPHLTIRFVDGKPLLRDESSSSGVYLAISGESPIEPGELFCAGQRLFKYCGLLGTKPPAPTASPRPQGAPVPPGPLYVIEEQLQGMRPGRTVAAQGPVLAIGSRKDCELFFGSDPSLAPRHCELRVGSAGAILADLSNGLGTFLRVSPKTDRELTTGDRFRVGSQTLEIQPA